MTPATKAGSTRRSSTSAESRAQLAYYLGVAMFTRTSTVQPSDACLCGSGHAFAACCGRFLDEGLRPETPELLMRSRYCAYVLQRALYLRETWHPRTRPTAIELDTETTWLGLTVLESATQDETHGTVAFTARYRVRGATRVMHERSRFELRRGAWVYVDGDTSDEA